MVCTLFWFSYAWTVCVWSVTHNLWHETTWLKRNSLVHLNCLHLWARWNLKMLGRMALILFFKNIWKKLSKEHHCKVKPALVWSALPEQTRDTKWQVQKCYRVQGGENWRACWRCLVSWLRWLGAREPWAAWNWCLWGREGKSDPGQVNIIWMLNPNKSGQPDHVFWTYFSFNLVFFFYPASGTSAFLRTLQLTS